MVPRQRDTIGARTSQVCVLRVTPTFKGAPVGSTRPKITAAKSLVPLSRVQNRVPFHRPIHGPLFLAVREGWGGARESRGPPPAVVAPCKKTPRPAPTAVGKDGVRERWGPGSMQCGRRYELPLATRFRPGPLAVRQRRHTGPDTVGVPPLQRMTFHAHSSLAPPAVRSMLDFEGCVVTGWSCLVDDGNRF